ncbi:MAG: MBL fold metallo-hydrolase [Victivallaceae bacterium]|nr:MBL fold metallo-hydrolase [Victivallaceae bacterium]
MKHFFPVAALFSCFFSAAALPFRPAEEWRLFTTETAPWENVDPAAFCPAPEKAGNIPPENILLDNGRFFRATGEHLVVAVLCNEFVSPSDGKMTISIGAAGYHLEVALNGKTIFVTRLSSNVSPLTGRGSHIIGLPVRKGKNTLAVKFHNARVDEKDGLYFICEEASPDLMQSVAPTRENFSAIAFSAPDTPQRRIEEAILRNGVDAMTATVFKTFDAKEDWNREELDTFYNAYPVLEFYDRALARVLAELPSTQVETGAVVWHLYNMGYVVKTPQTCFGIDIHHRRAAELAPLLDFLLVTHNHSDHYTLSLLKKMAEMKKCVITNFYPAKGYQRPPVDVKIGDVRIESEETDHNKTLQKFMSVYRVSCGENEAAPVLYHSGDSCDFRQLHPSGKIDIHIVHPRVGLSVPLAAEVLRPREIWFSHLLEMEHCAPSVWRPIPFDDADHDVAEIAHRGMEAGHRAPLWGEKIVLP